MKHLRDDLDIWATPILINMLWVVLSLLVVTIPLAFVGLFGATFYWMNDRNTNIISTYFGTIRRTWAKAYLVAFIDVLIGGFLYFNMVMFGVMDMSNILVFLSRSMTIFSIVVFVMINIYIWVLVAIWDAPLKQILKFSIQLVFAQPLWSIATCFGFLVPFMAAMILPSAIFIVCIGFISAYIACRGAWHVINKYVPSENFEFVELPS